MNAAEGMSCFYSVYTTFYSLILLKYWYQQWYRLKKLVGTPFHNKYKLVNTFWLSTFTSEIVLVYVHYAKMFGDVNVIVQVNCGIICDNVELRFVRACKRVVACCEERSSLLPKLKRWKLSKIKIFALRTQNEE